MIMTSSKYSNIPFLRSIPDLLSNDLFGQHFGIFFSNQLFLYHGECAVAKRHINPDGSEGGYVAASATVAQTAYVGHDVRISGNAKVLGSAVIKDNAMIFGNATICDSAEIGGNVVVAGTAAIEDSAKISGNAYILGNTRVDDKATVCGTNVYIRNSMLFGNCRVQGAVTIIDSAILDAAEISGNAYLFNSTVTENVTIGDNPIIEHCTLGYNAYVAGNSKLSGFSANNIVKPRLYLEGLVGVVDTDIFSAGTCYGEFLKPTFFFECNLMYCSSNFFLELEESPHKRSRVGAVHYQMTTPGVVDRNSSDIKLVPQPRVFE